MADQNSELIESVRIRSVLYDTNHKDYLKSKFKQKIWNEVARETNFPNGAEAKDKWEKLRHSLRDALRRQRKSGPDTKLWRYQKQMEFLQPFSSKWDHNLDVEDQESTPSILSPSTSFHLDNNSEESSNNCEKRVIMEFGTNEDEIERVANNKANHSNKYNNDVYNNHSNKRRAVKRERSEEWEDGPRVTETDSSTSDPLYYFFMAMYETTKRMPPTNQINVRNNLFHLIVSEENLIQNQEF